MRLDADASEGITVPEWFVTFADMMSLLLAFFIMMASLSHVKQQDEYQAMVDSIRKRFGHDTATDSLAPGKLTPRNASVTRLASMGGAVELDTHRGGSPMKASLGDHARVRIVRPGSWTTVGTVISFRQGSTELDEQQKVRLIAQAAAMRGTPQKIEIRGHSALSPPHQDSPFEDPWDLAYQRCRVTMDYLVDQGIEPRRLRLAVAGANEPIYTGTAPDQLRLNPRVEVHVLDEVVANRESFSDERPAEYHGGTRLPDARHK
jgi:chemotaxis protein MotB